MTLKFLIKHQLFHKSSSILYLSILASCTTLNSIDELPNNEYENIDESRFYVSNPNENLETTYNQCLEKSKRQIKIENIATRGAGGTIALTGIGVIASGLAAAFAVDQREGECCGPKIRAELPFPFGELGGEEPLEGDGEVVGPYTHRPL